MLRASAEATGRSVDLLAVGDPAVDPNLPGGRALLAFTDACVSGIGDLDESRRQLVAEVGPEGASAAARTCGNFEMMNRLLDATGVPVPIRMGEISSAIGIAPFTGR